MGEGWHEGIECPGPQGREIWPGVQWKGDHPSQYTNPGRRAGQASTCLSAGRVATPALLTMPSTL